MLGLSCGRQDILCSLQDLSSPTRDPMSPALDGGFLTTGPSGKSWEAERVLRYNNTEDFLGGSDGKESTCNADSIPGSGRSPGEGNGNPLQYSCLENFMDRRAWQTTYSPWDFKEPDITEGLTLSNSINIYNYLLSAYCMLLTKPGTS